MSIIYDLSGNGKTAVRVGFNKFMTAQTTEFAQLYNPTALTTFNLPWTDVNQDDIAQGERGCVYLTPGCENNFTNLRRTSASARWPDSIRTSSVLTRCRSTSASRTSFCPGCRFPRNTTVWFRDITLRVNTLLDENSYTQFETSNPLAGGTMPVWVLKRSSAAGSTTSTAQARHEADL